jgi:hypothetical protein
MIDIDSIRRRAVDDRRARLTNPGPTPLPPYFYSLEEVESLIERIDELEARIDNALSIARIP